MDHNVPPHAEAPPQLSPATDYQLQLALERTWLAHERTLMAWIRTSTSLITFGFALYKFFFYMREQGEAPKTSQLLGPRMFGLTMIGIGVFTLAVAVWQHRQEINKVRRHWPDAPFSLSLLVAALIAVLGVLAFLAAAVHE